MKNEMYLGDGVYATYCDGIILLDLRAQDNITRIALERETFDALEVFAKKVVGWENTSPNLQCKVTRLEKEILDLQKTVFDLRTLRDNLLTRLEWKDII